MDKKFVQTVDYMCKTRRKTPCIFRVNFCAQNHKATTSRAKLHFPTDFLNGFSLLFSQAIRLCFLTNLSTIPQPLQLQLHK